MRRFHPTEAMRLYRSGVRWPIERCKCGVCKVCLHRICNQRYRDSKRMLVATREWQVGQVTYIQYEPLIKGKVKRSK